MSSKTRKDVFKEIVGREPSIAEVEYLNKQMTTGKMNDSQYMKTLQELAKTEKQKPILAPDTTQAKPLTDYEQAEKLESERLSRKAEEEARLRKLSEEATAKTKLIEQQSRKEIEAWARQFDYETPRHREIRNRLYEISGKRGYEAEQQQLREEYISKNFEINDRIPVFTKVVSYESELLGMKIVRQGGHWVIKPLSEGSLDGYKERPKPIIDPETKMPIGYSILIQNAGLYDFIRRGMYGNIKIKLED